MGSVVGEKLSVAAKGSLLKMLPLICLLPSGGARMLEGRSLMQNGQNSAVLSPEDAGFHYFRECRPNHGGVLQSLATALRYQLLNAKALNWCCGNCEFMNKPSVWKNSPLKGFERSEFCWSMVPSIMIMIRRRNAVRLKYSAWPWCKTELAYKYGYAFK